MHFSSCLSNRKPMKACKIALVDFLKLGFSPAVRYKCRCGRLFFFFLSFKWEEVRGKKNTSIITIVLTDKKLPVPTI